AYAAASASLDALAARRQALGLPAVSVAWGLWDLPTAMTAAMSGTDRARLSAAGLAPLPAGEGLTALHRALAGGPGQDSHLVACRLDLPRLRSRAAETGDIPAVLRRLARAARQASPGARESRHDPFGRKDFAGVRVPGETPETGESTAAP